LFCSKIEPSKINLNGSNAQQEEEAIPNLQNEQEKNEIEKTPLTPPQNPIEEIQISTSSA
jgi:hypothetical protein